MNQEQRTATVKRLLTITGMKWKLLDEAGNIIRHTPTWRTENGAKRWAIRNGYSITKEG